MSIEPADRPKVKAECVRMIATLRLDPKKTRVIRELVEAYLDLNADEPRAYNKELESDDPAARKEISMIVGDITAGGMHKVILKVLSKRFGPIPGRRCREIRYGQNPSNKLLARSCLK